MKQKAPPFPFFFFSWTRRHSVIVGSSALEELLLGSGPFYPIDNAEEETVTWRYI